MSHRSTALHGTLEWNPDTLAREVDYTIYRFWRPYTVLRLSLTVPKQSTVIVRAKHEYHPKQYHQTDGIYPWYTEMDQQFHGLYVVELSGRVEIQVYTKKRKAEGDPDHHIAYAMDAGKRRPVRWPRYKKMVLRLVENDELTETSPVVPPPSSSSLTAVAEENDYPPHSLFTLL